MKPVKDMTDADIVSELSTMSLLNRVRAQFYHGAAMLEQKDAQPKPPGAIQRRRMEFEIAEKIIKEVRGETQLGAPMKRRVRVRVSG